MRRRIWWELGGAAAILVLFVTAVSLWAQPPSGRLLAHFIDVGQADAILIVDEARRCRILIDAGDVNRRYPESATRFRDHLSRHVPAGEEIQLAIATHPHSDHIGSMQWVLETYRVRTYVDNGQEHSSKLYQDLRAVVTRQRQGTLEYHHAERFPQAKEAACGSGGPRVRMLVPSGGFDPDVCELNQNNCSVVTKLTFGSTSFLFPGDAESEQEEALLGHPSTRALLESDVLKVGHHGSDTSSGEEFLEAVSPSWMIISAGKKDVGTNKGYRHPRYSTIRELLAFAGPRDGARLIDTYDRERKQWRRTRIWGGLYLTARDGTVVLSSNGTAIRKE